MTTGRRSLWFARILGVAFFSLVHLGVFMIATSAHLGGSLEKGPRGEELGQVYLDSPKGRRTRAIIEAMSWPLLRPIEIAEYRMPGNVTSSPLWRAGEAAAFYGNSLIWGIGLWAVLEVLLRGLLRLFRRS